MLSAWGKRMERISSTSDVHWVFSTLPHFLPAGPLLVKWDLSTIGREPLESAVIQIGDLSTIAGGVLARGFGRCVLCPHRPNSFYVFKGLSFPPLHVPCVRWNSEGAACIESLYARVVEITHQNKFATETDSDLHCNRVTMRGETRARWGLEVVVKAPWFCRVAIQVAVNRYWRWPIGVPQ